MKIRKASAVCITGLALLVRASALQGSHDWIVVGGTFRVMSDVGRPTMCAYDMAYVEDQDRLAVVSTPPERGEKPGRLEEVARLTKEIKSFEQSGKAVGVPYNTVVKAVEVTTQRDGHGIPKYARFVVLAGPLKGKRLWSHYGFVKTMKPLTGEPGVVQGKSAIWMPRRLGMLPQIEDAMARRDVAGLAALAASGDVASFTPGTLVKVSSSTVKGVYLIEARVGTRRFKGWTDRRNIRMSGF